MQPLAAAAIQAALLPATRDALNNICIFNQLDSTNRYALAQTADNAPLACLAEYQTAGRGQHGRHWLSPYASGLCLSLKYVYPSALSVDVAGLNVALAIMTAQTLTDLGVANVGIKWPNDIIWQQRKLAGLLLETRHMPDYQHLVIGIGLNVKTPALHMNAVQQPWVDLATALPNHTEALNRNVLAAQLLNRFLILFRDYPATGFTHYQPLWSAFDMLYGKPINLLKPHAVGQASSHYVKGIANGIDASGALLVDVAGQPQRYHTGEVSVRDATIN